MTTSTNPAFDTSGCGWISHGFEELAGRIERDPDPKIQFDVLIIGSGYGGAVAAMAFAGLNESDGRPLRVGVLERGKEYLPGSFPANPGETPGHIRIAGHNEGLFDIRLGPEVNTLIANGLGGGSLINAGVMETPKREVFGNQWPKILRGRTELDAYYEKARQLLGARTGSNGKTVDNTIGELKDTPRKFQQIERLAAENKELRFRSAAITVALDDSAVTSGNVRLDKCIGCGECVTGCNFSAKNSLDANLLVSAHRAGARIYTGATVLHIEQDGNHWIANTVFTNSSLRKRHGSPVPVRAHRIVLAAGTLGSTEILLRSRCDDLGFSNLLGHRCSTNGDAMITDYAGNAEVNAIADESVKPSERHIGPTITGIAEGTDGKFANLVIEEMAVPSSLKRVFAEVFATANTLHSLIEPDTSRHCNELPEQDNYSIRDAQLNNTALFAVMGDDTAGGRIELTKYRGDEHDGTGHIRWPGLPEQDLFERQVDAVTELTASTDGRVMPNPAWKLLPEAMEALMNGERGPLLTVHPLGGCAMADNARHGVVDDIGRVFYRQVNHDKGSGHFPTVYDTLVVLDGSVMPAALGTNPALTIAAVALRATEKLAEAWQLKKAISQQAAGAIDARQPESRPVLRTRETLDTASVPTPTQVRITERLSGVIDLRDDNGRRKKYAVELTLRFQPRDIAALSRPGGDPVVELDQEPSGRISDSRIRIFAEDKWTELTQESQGPMARDRELENDALFSAPLSGTLAMFQREPSSAGRRVLRALWAWFRNRGCRDLFQQFQDRKKGPGLLKRLRDPKQLALGIVARLKGMYSQGRVFFALASHGGEVRLEEYDLQTGAPEKDSLQSLPTGTRIHAVKRFTYSRRSNPWRQLMCVELLEFPGLPTRLGRVLARLRGRSTRRHLELDMDFLANIGVPLYQVNRQGNAVHALAELASYMAWFVRMLIGIHLWSFRLPDSSRRTEPLRRLPGRLPGLPSPEIKELYVGNAVPYFEPAGKTVPVFVRLTRYAQPHSDRPPIVMIHGYSASGTTFAHPAVQPNLASYFYEQPRGRDVWIVDLRTSAGSPTATRGWSFEQVAFTDIPAALGYIFQQTQKKLDVICHCMGAAMFSMAILDDGVSEIGAEYHEERRKLPELINRAVLSQIGPLIVFSPANRVRAMLARFLTEFLPDSYTFNPGDGAGLGAMLLDRALYSVPYPEHEFDIENPPLRRFWQRTPWTRTRHRMDALYGRAFNADRVDDKVLQHIDDFFGPMSIKTISQTIHFATLGTITNQRGRNTFVSRENLQKYWTFPTLGIHGIDNGLSNVATQDRLKHILKESEIDFETHLIKHAGHQDCLIGSKREKAMKVIEGFLDNPRPDKTTATEAGKPESVIAAGNLGTRVAKLGTALAQHFAPANDSKPVGTASAAFDDENQLVSVPWIGPLVTQHFSEPNEAAANLNPRLITIRIAATPYHKAPACAVLLPVRVRDGVVVNVSGQTFKESDVNQGMWLYRSEKFVKHGWDSFLVPPALSHDPETRLLVLVVYEESAKLAGIGRTAGGANNDATPTQSDNQIDPVYLRRTRAEYQVVRVDPRDWQDNDTDVDSDTWNSVTEEVWHRLLAQSANSAERPDRSTRGDSGLINGVVSFFPADPAGNDQPLRFALGSCQYQTNFLDGEPGFASYERLAKQLDADNGNDKPEMLVLAGDQIYVDARAGLLDPSIKDDDLLDKAYAAWLRNQHVRTVLRTLPSFMMLDDHEIVDNWEPAGEADANGNADALRIGREAYLKYQFGRMSNRFYHELGIPRTDRPGRKGHGLSYRFRFRGHPFFMLDTRTNREHRRVDKLGARLIAPTDWKELCNWLLANRDVDGPKFIVSPAMLLPRHRHALRWNCAESMLQSDGWDGYPASLYGLLAFIFENDIRHVVFLSGDEHRPCIAQIKITNSSHVVQISSVHAAPLYAPFPFANSLREHYEPGPFSFRHNDVRYECNVNATFPDTPEGFSLLHAEKRSGAWQLDVAFGGNKPHKLQLDVAIQDPDHETLSRVAKSQAWRA